MKSEYFGQLMNMCIIFTNCHLSYVKWSGWLEFYLKKGFTAPHNFMHNLTSQWLLKAIHIVTSYWNYSIWAEDCNVISPHLYQTRNPFLFLASSFLTSDTLVFEFVISLFNFCGAKVSIKCLKSSRPYTLSIESSVLLWRIIKIRLWFRKIVNNSYYLRNWR